MPQRQDYYKINKVSGSSFTAIGLPLKLCSFVADFFLKKLYICINLKYNKIVICSAFIFLFSCLNLFSQTDFYDINNIPEIKLYFRETNWDKILDSLFLKGNQERTKASLYINGKEYDDVGVRYKGYSSVDTSYIKNPLNIDLDFIHEDQDFEGIKKIKLSNVIHDPSFVREVLSYQIAGKYMPAPKANYAKVYINDTYYGLFTNVESVNSDFALNYFGSGDNALIKGAPEVLVYPFGSNANLQYYDNNISTYYPYYSLESEKGWEDLVRFIRILNQVPDSIEYVLNIDRTLWMHAFNYTLVNLDSYIAYAQNYYLYKNDYGRFNPVIWDLNMSFGSFRHSDGSLGALSGSLSINAVKTLDPLGILDYAVSPRPLITNIIDNGMYKRMYMAHIRTIVKDNFDSGDYIVRGNELQQLIDSNVYYDNNKFYSYNDFKNNLYSTVGGSGGMILYPGIQDLMEDRIGYLKNYDGYDGEPQISNITNSEIDSNGFIWINAQISGANNCFLAYHYNIMEPFVKINMVDDGNHHDSAAGDSVFGIYLTPENGNIYYYIYAENDSAGVFSPERAEYEFYKIAAGAVKSEVTINEISIGNISDCINNNGKSNWIELYNNTDNDIYLKKLFISDDKNNIRKFQVPDTVIKSKSFLVIYDNTNILSGLITTNFDLSEYGGKLYLAYSGNYILDSLQYYKHITGLSFGRYPDGTGNFSYMPPTCSSSNLNDTITYQTLSDGSLRIFPNPAYNYINFVLLNNNISEITVDITDLSGKLIYSQNFSNIYNSFFSGQLDISVLLKGMYFISINSENYNELRKFIKY